MFDLTEPSHSGPRPGPGRRWRAAPAPRSGRRAWCRCRGPRPRRRRRGRGRAFASAWRITRCCDGPFGAVRPLEAPSWLTAEPRTTAKHLVAVAPRVGEPLQQQQADALGPAGAVGRLGEGLAAAVGGEAALPAELDEARRRRHHGHAAGQRQRALALAQRLGRQVQRHQRGRARGVHRDRRALQPEGVGRPGPRRRWPSLPVAAGSPPGPPARRAPRAVVRGHRRRRRRRSRLPRSAVGSMPGVLERLPGRLQQQPLLRVHRQRLARGDAEEAGVEVGGVVEEAALAGVARAHGVGIRVVERVQVPAAVGGEARDPVAARRRPVRHRSSGERTPPGYRQAMPTIAIGSSMAAATAGRSAVALAARPRRTARRRRYAGQRGRRRVVEDQRSPGSRRPVAAASRLRSSTAVSESKPRSRKRARASIASARGRGRARRRPARAPARAGPATARLRGRPAEPSASERRVSRRRRAAGRLTHQAAEHRRQRLGLGLRAQGAAGPARPATSMRTRRLARALVEQRPGPARSAARRCRARRIRASVGPRPRWPVMPLPCAHRPQAERRARPGPARARCAASASRKALAAA